MNRSKRGLRYRHCVATLPGKPDFVFTEIKLAVFVDGDFWHGWRLPEWKDKLQPYWLKKRERTRRRDRSNFRCLRRKGWTVLRFWSHQVARDLMAVVERIEAAVTSAGAAAEKVRNGSSCRNHLRGSR